MAKLGFIALSIVLAVQVSSAYELAVPVFRQPYGVGRTRIVGGQNATKGQFPYQAALTLDDTYFCGGSLISKTWVLTAGHCVQGILQWKIVLGALNIKENEPGHVTLGSVKAILHENFDSFTITNDIGLIALPEEVTLNDQINIIPLPPRTFQKEDFSGKTARVSGWGRTSDSSTGLSETLQFVDLEIIKPEVCKKVYGDPIITNTKYCCSGANSKSTCNGDSGGSLTTGEGTNRTHLGIVSFGSSLGCAKGFPTGFTATAFFIDWVSKKTGIPVQDF